MRTIGLVKIQSADAQPFAREKLRLALLAAGSSDVAAGKVTAELSQKVRALIPAHVDIQLDGRHMILRLSTTTGSGTERTDTVVVQLPGTLDSQSLAQIQSILSRMSREELMQDLEHQVVERTKELNAEREKTEMLLNNVLPRQIARRIKQGERIADRREATVMFIDVVGFTTWAAKLAPSDLLDRLESIFEYFDTATSRYELEKIKTMGDSYMAASGVPVPQVDHVDRAIRAALDINHSLPQLCKRVDLPIKLRIGIHTGPVVAGVIGTKKAFYDVWGDTVNIASRMESQGAAGKIHVTDQVRHALSDDYKFDERGVVKLRNLGEVNTWFVSSKA